MRRSLARLYTMQHRRVFQCICIFWHRRGLHVSARYSPTQRHFVIEADEYDTAFFDKRSKFVHYRPHRDPEQPRIRSRRHLSRSGRHRNPIPSPGPHHSRLGPHPAPDAFRRARPRTGARLLVGNGHVRRRWPLAGVRTRRRGRLYRPPRRSGHRHGALVARRRTQPHERAGRAGRRRPCRRAGGPGHRGAEPLRRRQAPHGIARHGPGREGDDFAHHPTAIATTIAGLRRQVGRPASWPCWSPAPTP